MRVPNIIALGIMLLLVVLLQACGRKGPLYLQSLPVAPMPVAPVVSVSGVSMSESPASAVPALPAQSGVPQLSPMQKSSTIQNSNDPVKQP